MTEKIYSNESITLYCEKEHWTSINGLSVVDGKSLIVKPINVVRRVGNGFMKKFIIETMNIVKIFLKNPDAKLIIFFSVFSNVQPLLLIIAKFFPKKTVILCNHGELEALVDKSSHKIYKYGFWIKLSFLIKEPRNLFRLVLGESIKKNLEKHVPNSKIIAIEHPYIFNNLVNSDLPHTTESKIKFGIIGEASVKKGSSLFFDIANQYTDAIQSHKCQFEVVGRIVGNLQTDSVNNVIFHCNANDLMPLQQFEYLAAQLSYAVYLYPIDSYKLIASGAIFDALKFGTPIIALKNDYFEAIFEKCGDIGFLCENHDQLNSCIHSIIYQFDSQRYTKQRLNILTAQKYYSIDTISNNFASSLNSTISKEDL
jgi:hypothetical protein